MKTTGSQHRRPRSDSAAVRLWRWARERAELAVPSGSSGQWAAADAAAACTITERRCRAILGGMERAGMVERDPGLSMGKYGREPDMWRLTELGRNMQSPPILTVDSRDGIVGVRT